MAAPDMCFCVSLPICWVQEKFQNEKLTDFKDYFDATCETNFKQKNS